MIRSRRTGTRHVDRTHLLAGIWRGSRYGWSWYDFVRGPCRSAGFEPRIGDEATKPMTLVAAGVGVTLVPAAIQDLRRSGIDYRPITAPAPRTARLAPVRVRRGSGRR